MRLETLAALASDRRLPADEKWDVNAEAFHMLKANLLPGPLDDIREAVVEVLANEALMEKALRLEPYHWKVEAERSSGAVSILQLNEMGVVGGVGPGAQYIERPGSGFEFLRHASTSVDIVQAILLTFCRRVESMARPAGRRGQRGFKLVRRDGEKMTPDDVKDATVLSDFVMNCGDEDDPAKRKRLRRETFPKFTRKYIWDSLALDAPPVELQRRANSKLSGFYNVDGASVRLCSEEGYEGDDEIQAVQLIEGLPTVAYRYEDLVYEVRNPRTDLLVTGYGYSELEMMLKALTGYLAAFDYNKAGLDRNAIPRGLMMLYGDFKRKELDQVQRNLKAMLHGGGNRWITPILASRTKEGGAQWVKMDDHDEMGFARMISLTVSIPCALYGIDPQEISFDSFSTKTQSALRGDDAEERLDMSKAKGLLPLVNAYADTLNGYVLPAHPLGKKFELQFVGLEKSDEKAQQDRQKLVLTTNELREEMGLPEHADPILGNAPLNPAQNQFYMMRLQSAMQGQPGPERPDDDYQQDGDGGFEPYGQMGAPEGDHLHTIQFGDDGGEAGGPDGGGGGGGGAGAPGGGAPAPMQKAFRVVIERGRGLR